MSDGLGGVQQAVLFSATSSGANPFLQMNIANGGPGAFAELGLVFTSAIVDDAANGSHTITFQHVITFEGQVGTATTYDFSPFIGTGTGSYTLTNPDASAGSLIAFVDQALTGPASSYALLSNGYTATASPEPGTLVLLCVGTPLCALVARRRKSSLA
jgi:hypothetical protein